MLALLALTLTAPAATFAHLPDLDVLAEQSDAVVQGVVVEAVTEVTPAGLQTRYVVQVDQALAGDAPATVDVLLPGGRYQGLTQRAAGIPLWSVGSEVVVFVPDSGWAPLYGVLTIEEGRPIDLLSRPVPASVDGLADLVRGAR